MFLICTLGRPSIFTWRECGTCSRTPTTVVKELRTSINFFLPHPHPIFLNALVSVERRKTAVMLCYCNNIFIYSMQFLQNYHGPVSILKYRGLDYREPESENLSKQFITIMTLAVRKKEKENIIQVDWS